VHSLKGAARSVNLTDVESLCHSLESLFAAWKRNQIGPSPALLDLVHHALDELARLVASEAPPGSVSGDVAAVIRRLDAVAKGAAPQPAPAGVTAESPSLPPPPPPHAVIATTIRVRTEKLDSMMRQTEELLVPRLAAQQRVAELHEVLSMLRAWKKELEGIRPSLRALDAAEVLKRVESRLATLERSAESDQRALAAITDSLLRDVKEMQMLPFASLLDALPRLARDIARAEDKQVDMRITGSEIEVDRRILEELKDPLNHLVRNCIDHGIEPPPARQKKGKPPHGTISIAVAHKDNKVELVLADDGAGVDLDQLKAAAERVGLVADGGALLPLMFESGVSTTPIITEMSGRGLGLAIVKEKVDRLGGTVSAETRGDAGTAVRIVVPLTLATFRGVLVRSGGRLFIVPAANVERVMRAGADDVRTVENRETLAVEGEMVSLAWLSDVLELPRGNGEAPPEVPVVVLGKGRERIGFRVDAVVAEQEVLVKPLGPQLARVRNVSGVSVLGSGEVVPVLNASDLMQSAVVAAEPRAVSVEPQEARQRRSILVAEDSITSRTLLKSILEAAGYEVTTAVDGLDAWTTLRTRPFDLIVSDVEMPRMDGFDLTAKIRADARLSQFPVVLVTALESREHRERGIDVGANAYIVKSSFDQSNLLDVIRRLI